MGSLVESQIRDAIRAVVERDGRLAEHVIAEDERVNEMQREIADTVLMTIATQSHVARDLRFLMALDHVGSSWSGSATTPRGSPGCPPAVRGAALREIRDLARIGNAAEQVRGVVSALIDIDDVLARQVAARDDEIDHSYRAIFGEIIELMRADPDSVESGTRVILAAHWVERIGDRVTNIAEDVVYLATGQVEDLNHDGDAAARPEERPVRGGAGGIAEEGGVEEGQPGQGVRDAQAPAGPAAAPAARPTTLALTLYLVRHADAGDPAAWTGNDADRPLSKKGRRQSKRLGDLLDQLRVRPDAVLHRHGSAPRIPRSCLAGEIGRAWEVDGRLDAGFDAEGLTSRLSMSDSAASAVVLVGHDPDFSRLASWLSMPRWSCRRAPSSASIGGSSGRAWQRRAALADSAGRRPGLKPGNRDAAMERVLFLCTHNSARSQMAEGLLRAWAGDRYDVESAGVEATEVRPRDPRDGRAGSTSPPRRASASMAARHSTSPSRSATRPEACPFFPGAAATLHWRFDDPAAATGTEEERLAVFRRVRDEIGERIRRGAWRAP